ncbi:hypothetical protein OF83DRAFT_509206 [Amylostereum chailletii]|nr:hypothetical protein OF83DRAFT_509206 [Amylostereum chailletii]
MAYNGQSSSHYTGQEGYNPYPDAGQYNDPYSAHRPHASDDQGGLDSAYRDEPFTPPNAAGKETPADPDTYSYRSEKEKTPQNLRAWRYDHQGNLWTKGGRWRCCGRFFCCTILVTLFLIIGIVLSLVLYARPPNIIIGDITVPTSSPFSPITNGLQINLDLPVQVSNPNYFGVKLPSVKANIFYNLNNNETHIGNGTLDNVQLPSGSNKNITFPFSLVYTPSIDPSGAILQDLLQKCFGSGGNLDISYKINVAIKVASITINLPSINNQDSFACPIPESALTDALGGLGLNTSDVQGLINGLINGNS